MINSFLKQQEEIIFLMQILSKIRADHPTISCRSMYYMINPVTVGRDKFERICKELGFAVEIKKKYVQTTDSTGVIRFPNLTENLILTHIDQVYSSDITYFKIGDTFYYITFILYVNIVR